MLVKELVTRLLAMPQEAEVRVYVDADPDNDTEGLQIFNLADVDSDTDENGAFVALDAEPFVEDDGTGGSEEEEEEGGNGG